MDIKDPRTQKFLLIGIALAAVFYLYFFSTFVPFGHRALSAQKAELKVEYEQLTADLNKARQTLNNLEEVERQYQLITRRWEVASTLLPEDRELATLLRKVTLVGQQSGVSFHLFEPKAQVAGEIVTENPVSVEVVGGYHQVGSFLAEVANLDRIVNVSQLHLITDTTPDKSKTVHAKFTATAYTLNGAYASGSKGGK